MMKSKAIAIIPARGGSKRIPHKNIKTFDGRPIIEYAIDAAIQCGKFQEVMVSTDSPKIKEIAINAGAHVPFLRSDKTSGDFASTEDVLKEVINQYMENDRLFETYCCIYPAVPFLTQQTLGDAMECFSSDAQALFMTPVVKFSYPPQRSYRIDENQLVRNWEEYKYTRTQDLETWYHDCGQFYIGDVKALLEKGMSNGYTMPYVIDELHVQDIDTEMDWAMAEIKYKYLVTLEER